VERAKQLLVHFEQNKVNDQKAAGSAVTFSTKQSIQLNMFELKDEDTLKIRNILSGVDIDVPCWNRIGCPLNPCLFRWLRSTCLDIFVLLSEELHMRPLASNGFLPTGVIKTCVTITLIYSQLPLPLNLLLPFD
jgi:hypothetical protein